MSQANHRVEQARPFRGPSRVWFGPGASTKITELVQEFGGQPGPALLVTDGAVEKLDLARGVKTGLSGLGFEIHRFSEIPGEPTVEVADRAAAVARELAPRLVVGVGGGSVMDVAKLSAAMVHNPGSVVDYTNFVGRRFTEPAITTVLVPTTAGTGAEASQNAVVTMGVKKAFANNHPQLLAAGAILDPTLTHSLPPTVTAHTGLDALSHCIEGILSTNATRLTDAMATQGIALIFEALPRVFAKGDDAEARAQMMLGAYMGGLALNAGMILGHSIAYTIANRLHLPHGMSCALALPYSMAYNREVASPRLRHIEEAAGLEDATAIERVQRLCQQVGIAQEGLRALGVERERLPELVAECLEQYPRPNNPRSIKAGSLLSLYAAMWEGRPAHAWNG